MGIDAEMYVGLNKSISNEQLKVKSYIFGSAFHYDLWLGNGKEIHSKPLDIWSNKYSEDTYWLIKGTEQILEVPLMTRYYGIGYERGPLMVYVNMASFLEKLLAEFEPNVYYGGDSGEAAISLFDNVARERLINHFIKFAHDPYRRYFGQEVTYVCPVCDIEMTQSGWGPNYTYHSCAGCGWQKIVRDDKINEGFDIKGNK